MQSPNTTIASRKHVNFSLKQHSESPLFIIPSFFVIPTHDVNLEIIGFSIGFIFLQWVFQINFRKEAWKKYPSNVDIIRANDISSAINQQEGQVTSIDAMSVMKAFERNRWLRELTSRKLEKSYYGLKIIKEVAKEEAFKKDYSQQRASFDSLSESIQVDGLE